MTTISHRGGLRWSQAVSPYDEANLQPNSYDLHIGTSLLRLPYGVVLDPEADQAALWQPVPLIDGRWLLGQNVLYLASTHEQLTIPADLVGHLHGVSTLGRLGLLVHVTAGLLDSGYSGNPTLELVSLGGGMLLRPGQRIAQLTLDTVEPAATLLYGDPVRASRYQHDSEPTPARVRA